MKRIIKYDFEHLIFARSQSRLIIYRFLVLLIICCFGNVSFGQYTPTQQLIFLGQSDGQKVSLRWSVTDFDVWQEGNAVGYTLERYTTIINGTPLNPTQLQNSRQVLSNNLKPLTEGQWNSQFPNNDFAKVAKGALYEQDATAVLSGAPTLADAINIEQSKEARFVFGLFVAEQDFEVAKGLALGYEDNGIQGGRTYLYTLKLNSTNPDFSNVQAVIKMNADDIPSYPAVTEIKGESLDKAIMIEWNIKSVSDRFSSFDIERSTDGVNFTKANDLPFIFGAEGEENPTTAAYKDDIPNNTTIYHYRVRGRTPFGTQGPPSEVISLSGTPARINLSVKIDDHVTSETNNVLNWDSFDSSKQSEIKGFNIYRSVFSNHSYEKLNGGFIAASNRSFTDNDPLKMGYYKLEAIDNNDHDYLSPAHLIQQADSIPPAIPTGLSGEFITSKKVQLNWDANTEEDLKGYRLFVSNGMESNFTQITKRAIEGEQFIYEIDPKFLVEKIYFKILATDTRDNYSEKSEAIELDRPDIVGPSNPVLFKVSPTPKGIEIGFKFSSSADRVNHELERKRKGAPDWEIVLDIAKANENEYLVNLTPNSTTSTSYLDSTILERREYQYRLLAYDDDGNLSSSDVIEVRPYDNGRRGEIENFKVYMECTPTGDIPKQQAFNTLDLILKTYEQEGTISTDSLEVLVAWNIITAAQYNELVVTLGSGNDGAGYKVYMYLKDLKMSYWGGSNLIATIELSWDYEALEQLQDFQIFRSTEGSSLSLYKTLSIEDLTDFEFLDEDVKPKRRYFYQVMARHLDGGFSDRSKTLMVKVPAQ